MTAPHPASLLDDSAPMSTSQVLREVMSLEHLAMQRMDAIEKAVTVAHENLVRVPTDVDKAIGHLHELMNEVVAHLRLMMDERDLRYDQRFKAQTEAVSTAMTAAEKAVAAALSAADRAVAKAETASERRFESVNEFRASLNDMTRLLIPRSEADKQFGAIAEKVDSLHRSISEKVDSLQQRMDKTEGSGAGLQKGWGILLGLIGLVSSVVAIVVVLSQIA